MLEPDAVGYNSTRRSSKSRHAIAKSNNKPVVKEDESTLGDDVHMQEGGRVEMEQIA